MPRTDFEKLNIITFQLKRFLPLSGTSSKRTPSAANTLRTVTKRGNAPGRGAFYKLSRPELGFAATSPIPRAFAMLEQMTLHHKLTASANLLCRQLRYSSNSILFSCGQCRQCFGSNSLDLATTDRDKSSIQDAIRLTFSSLTIGLTTSALREFPRFGFTTQHSLL